jgi:hypothetical protein
MAMKRLISLPDKHQPCHYLVQSQLSEYLNVLQERQLRTGLSTIIKEPGEICQVIDMTSFS